MKLGVVLSGGGSKGAYQIGVWKALRKLNINYDLVTGTSVGALNAALMCQNKFYKAVRFWSNLTFDDVIDTKIEQKDKKSVYKMYLKGMLKGGMTVNNLEKTVDAAISVRKIYKSNIDFGLITFNTTTLKPLKLVKKGIPKHKFKDYLIASATCFPAFSKKVIDNEKFIDGGVYDNLPINLAITMGAEKVIAVDLEEIGFKQKVKNKNIDITYIKPRNDIGSFLIFEKSMARRAIRLGYNDTMKEFKKLDGDKYTFVKLYNSYTKIFDECNYKLGNKKIDYEKFIDMIENLGDVLKIDDSYIYNLKKFNKIIIKKFIDIKEEDIKNIKDKKVRAGAIKYIYNNLDNFKISKYFKIFQKEYMCALYLKLIMN